MRKLNASSLALASFSASIVANFSVNSRTCFLTDSCSASTAEIFSLAAFNSFSLADFSAKKVSLAFLISSATNSTIELAVASLRRESVISSILVIFIYILSFFTFNFSSWETVFSEARTGSWVNSATFSSWTSVSSELLLTFNSILIGCSGGVATP